MDHARHNSRFAFYETTGPAGDVIRIETRALPLPGPGEVLVEIQRSGINPSDTKRRAGWASTCLSRSLSGRLLLDLIGVANELHLGMSKFSDGRKVPHAWLRDPQTGRLYTPGLTPGAGVPLTKF